MPSDGIGPDVWLCLVFAALMVLVYALWCWSLVPRVRMVLALVATVCFAVAIGLRHADLFAAAPTKPALPLAQRVGGAPD